MYFPPIHTLSYNKAVQAFEKGVNHVLQNKKIFKVVIYIMLIVMLLSSLLFTAGLFFSS
nr:stressosome-associated protein Prli42 [Paenibacillus pectinilyticus]